MRVIPALFHAFRGAFDGLPSPAAAGVLEANHVPVAAVRRGVGGELLVGLGAARLAVVEGERVARGAEDPCKRVSY